MEIPVLTTERLRLRGCQSTDLDNFSTLNSNPDFVRYLGDGKPVDRCESWRVLSMLAGHWLLKGFGLWIVEEKATGKFVGRVGLWEPEGWPGVEIGWGIAPEFWGMGYATESALASMRWGFENLHVKELISIIHPDNEPSKKVALKVGEKYNRVESVHGKEFEIYSIFKSDFLAGC